MRRLIPYLFALSGFACSSEPVEPANSFRFVLIQFGRPVDSSDARVVGAIGGVRTLVLVPFAEAMVIETDRSQVDFLRASGVVGTTDLGSIEGTRSVYITDVGPPTREDLSFVKSISGRPAYVFDNNVIGTVMRPSIVESLDGDIRLKSAVIGSDVLSVRVP